MQLENLVIVLHLVAVVLKFISSVTTPLMPTETHSNFKAKFQNKGINSYLALVLAVKNIFYFITLIGFKGP